MAPHRESPIEGLSRRSSQADLLAGVHLVDDATRNRMYEPIAIIGMACRLPGEATTPSRFWDLLIKGRSGQCDVPPSRFNLDGFYHPKVDRPGSIHMRGGYFLEEDIRAFDNEFFGINNMEATHMDPQQRKLLEVVFECFESAGLPLEKISGSNMGCYIGNFTADFLMMQSRDTDELHRYNATGAGLTILSNRISHIFNLTGPSVVLDTACSSSLYGLHAACSALQMGDCDSAVVAAANLIQSIEQLMMIMKAGVLSKTSTCHTFDSAADGYGRADGVGALVLKRLSDAIRDGDPIRSVIRGTAVNANGRTQGITLPSAGGQESVMRKAYAAAGLEFDQTGYVECHGTGTPVGDPIEVDAVSRVFKRKQAQPLLIGSVKTNVGHSEAASALSSIIKLTMALETNVIPPTIGISHINPKLRLDERGIKVATQTDSWPKTPLTELGPGLRRGGVNSFGYGGANGHAILDNAFVHLPPKYGTASERGCIRKSFLLPISASSKDALFARIADLSSYDLKDASVLDLLHTLGSRRSHLSKRGYLLTSKSTIKDDLHEENLRTLLEDVSNSPLQLAFVFTGQGAQWPQMCKGLFEEFIVFRNAIIEMDTALQGLPHPPSWRLEKTILEPKETSRVMEPAYSQPTCTAIQVAMVTLLASWDITASAVVGHSSGEIAAAFAAGLITSAEAITIAYYRGLVVSGKTLDGGMMAVSLSKHEANQAIADLKLIGQIRVACVNSPSSVTISGDASAIDILLKDLEIQGRFARKLQTGGRAYHSHHMLAFGDEYEGLLRTNNVMGPSVRMPPGATWISSVTGLHMKQVSPRYWRDNLEQPVEFEQAVSTLAGLTPFHFLEIGPHSALEQPIKQIKSKLRIAEQDMPYSTAITRNKDSIGCILGMVGRLYLHGKNISFDKVNGLSPIEKGSAGLTYRVLHDLPPYRWSYAESPLCSEPRASSNFRSRLHPRHELLGSSFTATDGVNHLWKNTLSLREVSWLEDHKLEETVVFPAAGYLAMIIEAICQVSSYGLSSGYTVEMSNVNILSALVLPADIDHKTEIHTSLRPLPLTYTSNSKHWWEFSIISIVQGISTTHCAGTVGATASNDTLPAKLAAPKDVLEPSAPRIWYEQLAKKGLNFGPQFRSITDFSISRLRNLQHCKAALPWLQQTENQNYPIHPITIDAMLQASIAATTAGNTDKVTAKVPTQISSATFVLGHQFHDKSCSVNANASVAGFGSALINVELATVEGQVSIVLENVRLAAYEAGKLETSGYDRHPMLRVLWKPDPSTGAMKTHGLQLYLDKDSKSDRSSDGVDDLIACLDLFGHKNPSIRVLELGSHSGTLKEKALDILSAGESFPRLLSYTTGVIDKAGQLHGVSVDLNNLDLKQKPTILSGIEYDLILIPSASIMSNYLKESVDTLKSLMARGATILAVSQSAKDKQLLTEADLEVVASKPQCERRNWNIVLARKVEQHSTGNVQFILVESETTSLGNAIAKELAKITPSQITRILLSELSRDSISKGAIVFSLVEIDRNFLAHTSEEDLDQVKVMTDNSSALIWITAGNLLSGGAPDRSLVFGLSRAVCMEQPSLRFMAYDIDDVKCDTIRTAENIVSIATRETFGLDDHEYMERQGIIHISRFVPDEGLNKPFRLAQSGETVKMRLSEAKPAQVSINTPGQFDTIFFKPIQLPSPGPHEVQVSVKAIGLNAKDYYALGGKVDTKEASCSLEYCGIVERIGSSVTSLVVGDRVVVMAPSFMRTSETVPAWACQKLMEEEDFNVMCTLPVVYGTAIYALYLKADLQQGESVLIHSAAGGVGIAAIQLAKLVGAEIFATVSTREKKDYLVKTFGLNPKNVFTSRDTSFATALMQVTNGRGVDVVLNSLTGDLLHASWRCLGEFGRFIEIGKRDLTDSGRLEMDQFLRNTTFSAFDLSLVYSSRNPAHHRLWTGLMKQVLQLYREKKISEFPLEVFDIQELPSALRRFGLRSRIGKITVNMERPDSVLRVQPSKYSMNFHPTKSYLMIGCLGGLGRSLAKWMMERGARRFVFLGRSGLDKMPARRLVEDLTYLGATCKVVRGDVCSLSDVQLMVGSANGPIGGVVQAAMGLNHALFSAMPNKFWHIGIDPKVQGTWNIHNALKGKDIDLDFFLLTSSISGSVGTATESNYCAANYFLDNFARYRRSQGLPATSVGLGMISEVGYLHENPEIESILLRKGIQQINESEMLSIIDISLSRSMDIAYPYDMAAEAHILTGLEPFGLLELRKKGFNVTNPVMINSRSSILARALQGHDEVATTREGGLPPDVTKAVESGCTLADAITACITKRFGDLVLLPANKVSLKKPLDEYGMDSMIAAEFRSWFFQSFKVDVPFLELLGKTTTVSSLSKAVLEEVEARQ